MNSTSIHGVLLGFFLTCLSLGAETIRPSYTAFLELQPQEQQSINGVDIWMSSDQKRSWVMIGRTYGPEEAFTYRVDRIGFYYFHFKKRSETSKPTQKPTSSSVAHRIFDVKSLESNNTRLTYASSRKFNIEYNVDDLPTVQGRGYRSFLWYTENSGITWRKYGEDTDGQSPVLFEAPRDGLYGFKIVPSMRPY